MFDVYESRELSPRVVGICGAKGASYHSLGRKPQVNQVKGCAV